MHFLHSALYLTQNFIPAATSQGSWSHFFFFLSHFSGVQNVAHSPFLVKDFLLNNVFSVLASAGQGSPGHPLILQDELVRGSSRTLL